MDPVGTGKLTASSNKRYGGVDEALTPGRTLLVAAIIISFSSAGSVEMAMILPMTWLPLFASDSTSVSTTSDVDAKMALISVAAAAVSVVCVMTVWRSAKACRLCR